MGFLGATIYHFDATIAARLRLLQPSHLVVGEGVWFALRDIADIVGPECLLILRDVLGATLTNQPGVIASRIEIAAKSSGVFEQCIAHGLNEEYSLAERAAPWELSFIRHCHRLGLPTICLNGAVGNDPPDVLRYVAEASDFVGWHCYDFWDIDLQQWMDRVHSSRRYARDSWPAWWPRHKHIPTEVGVEAFPPQGRAGWQALGIPAETVKYRIFDNISRWKEDGLLGSCWFTLGHSDTSWESYYATDDQLRSWAAVPVNPTPVPLPTPNHSEPELAMPTIADVQEKLLEVHRTLNEAKEAPNFTAKGVLLDRAYAQVGDAYNLLQQMQATPPNL